MRQRLEADGVKHAVEERFWPKVEKTESCWLWRCVNPDHLEPALVASRPPVTCPECGSSMRPGNLARHRRTHLDGDASQEWLARRRAS